MDACKPELAEQLRSIASLCAELVKLIQSADEAYMERILADELEDHEIEPRSDSKFDTS